MEKMNSLHCASVEFPSTMVASILQGMISYTDHFISPPLLAESSKRYGVFFNASRPHISLHNYVQRIAKHFKCSPSCFVVALIYIDRIVNSKDYFFVCHLNIHR